jgi:hypothetical protein
MQSRRTGAVCVDLMVLAESHAGSDLVTRWFIALLVVSSGVRSLRTPRSVISESRVRRSPKPALS